MSADMRVSVVTPATGHRDLPRCCASVMAQTYPSIDYYVVVDGAERAATAAEGIRAVRDWPATSMVVLPHRTGSGGYNGHRIYGAFSFLVPGDVVVFLDEDNWIEPDHVESLVRLIADEGLDWAHSLRRIWSKDGELVCEDDCQSLGRWPVYHDPSLHHVDLNCYALTRKAAMALAHVVAQPYGGTFTTSSDHLLCQALLKHFPRFATTGLSTVNYVAGGSVPPEYFLIGNEQMRARYPDGMPWRKR